VREGQPALLRIVGRFAQRVSRGHLAPDRQEEIAEEIFCDGPGQLQPYVLRLITLTALSTVIAAFGLIANSPAVVIGAMLVAPLMRPIIGIAAALVLGRPRAEFISAGLVLLTTAEAFVISLLVGLAVPSFRVITLTPELLARTAPTLLDLGIAVAAGAAGAYLTVRGPSGGAIAGVAVAVALLPPLSACGILLAHGNDHLAGGAFVLFLTNLVGIVLSAVVVFLITGLVDHRRLSGLRWLAVAAPLFVVLAVAYPLGRRSLHTFQVSSDEGRIRSVLLPRLRDAGLGIQSLTVIRRDHLVIASLDVVGPTAPPDVHPIALQLGHSLGSPVRIIFRWTRREEFTGAS
jgi:uncharacterized hydrophobic protein (TIGR00271 family)